MGYANDLGTAIVAGVDSITGYPKDRYGHLLDPTDLYDGKRVKHKKGTELYNLTSPYGHLEFAIGTGDDFTCFDYRIITGKGNVKYLILHSVVNSETGSFIQDGSYSVTPLSEVTFGNVADVISEALDWLNDDINPLRHDKRGWNQDPYYFYRCVCLSILNARGVEVPGFSQRQKRFGGKRIDNLLK